jgi:hemolysin activation/secretion protein
LIFFVSQSYAAITNIPGSAEPGLVKKNYVQSPIITAPQTKPSIQSTDQKVTPLSPDAEKIKFKLVKIVLEGNHVYSEKDLLPLYKNSLNKEISVLDLQNLVQDISNYYRNNGYILSRALLPPQNITNGVVKVKIIEGYIHKVHVIGSPKGAKSLIQAYGDQISAVRPTQVNVM